MQNFITLDSETTGLSAEKGDRVLELAVVYRENGRLISKSSFVNPEDRPIPYDAMGLHHITPDMVKEAPSLDHVIKEFDLPEGYVCAHNAAFDKNFLPQLAYRPWLCTMRCAMHLYPDAPNYKNNTIRYFLGLNPEIPEGIAPHRALYDVLVTHAIVEHILKDHTLQELSVLQNKPVLQRIVRFGKHRNQEWKTVPLDYLRWYLRQDDIDPDVKYTCQYYLNG